MDRGMIAGDLRIVKSPPVLTLAPGFARLRSDEEALFLCSPQTLNDFLVIDFF